MHPENNILSALAQRPDPTLYSIGKKSAATSAAPSEALQPAAKTSAAAPTKPIPAAAPAAVPEFAEAEPLTLAGLRRAWGTDDPRYDLDRNGSVNMSDMLSFLAQQSGKAGDPSSSPKSTDPDAPSPPGSFAAVKDNAGGSAPAPPLTLEGLMAVWGKSDERYDFNRDGVVNMPDLLKFMTKLSPPTEPGVTGNPAVPDEKVAGVATSLEEAPVVGEAPDKSASLGAGTGEPDAEGPPPGPLTVDGLMEVWGKADDRYDLNADGVVNMEDLLSLLSRLGGEQTTEQVPPGPATVNSQEPPSISSGKPAEDPPSAPFTLQGLLDVWGKTSDLYDFNNDGVVGMQDLLSLLSKLGDENKPSTGNPTSVNAGSPLVSSIVSELKANGFESQPPVNIHQLVGNLNLAPSLEKDIIEDLAKEYPSGLGLNMLG